jgi:hypothetical protein
MHLISSAVKGSACGLAMDCVEAQGRQMSFMKNRFALVSGSVFFAYVPPSHLVTPHFLYTQRRDGEAGQSRARARFVVRTEKVECKPLDSLISFRALVVVRCHFHSLSHRLRCGPAVLVYFS